ncbi:MAG: methyltransferase domain-containing protein [Paraclostridium sp.]
MSNIYTSRFILREDKKTNICLFKIPINWYSRCYEYKWAMNFVGKDDICLDAACGIPHPFKFYLASTCDNVYAFDISNSILNKDYILNSVENFFDNEDYKEAVKYIDKINFSVASLTNLPYLSSTFSRIFCIASLKCLNLDELETCLKEFYRTLKNKGYLILTFDIPPMDLNKVVCLISSVGFEFVGNLDLTKPNTALCSPLPCCNNCFRMLLTKIN